MDENYNNRDDKTQSHFVLTEGTMIGHYRIVEKIGAGGMGEVYLAEDTKLNRQVALKFLPDYLKSDEDAKSRFTREAQAAASLNHPNIVIIYEVSEFKGRPYFAMECCEGETLKEIIKKEELSLDKIIDFAIQIGEGLQEAHEAGIVHRDIKPSNIILDKKGCPKLVDFGLATVKGTEKLTKTGSTLGTIGYMSPEQIQVKEIDHRTDLFSLGVVLYELTAGRLPFKGDNEASVMNAVLNDTPEPLSRYKSGVPDDLQRIIDKLLDKDPDLRYQSAADVVSDLKRLTATRPVAVQKPVDWWNRYVVVGAVLVLGIIGIYWLFTQTGTIKSPSKAGKPKMLVVLPFENLGNPDDEYFADGITDEVTTRLIGLSGLGVISRTSSMQYKNTDKSLRQIGKELDVDYILEGTIRWEKKGSESLVRINPRLIRVSDDMHLWASSLDAVLTDVFEVQSTIAQEVAAALDVTLLQSEQQSLSRKTKVDPKAYDFYLRGKQYFSEARHGQQDLRLAETMHLRAIELAPDFAPAYAQLGAIYTEMYWDLTDPSPERLESAKKMVDMSISLAPHAPEGYQSLGWYYYHGLRDYDRALQEFSKVLELQPNNTLAIASIAWVQRRQGKWDEAIGGLQKVTKLDPRDPWYKYEMGITYHYCRRFQEAIDQYNQAIDLQPNHNWAYILKSWALLNETGETREARAVLDSGRIYNGRWPELTWLEVHYDLCDGEYDQALSLMTTPGDVFYLEYPDTSDYYSLKGFTYKLMGQQQAARIYFDSARVPLENKLSVTPDIAPLLSSLAIVYAGLGQAEKAVSTAKQAAELKPVSEDALEGPNYIRTLAMVYVQTDQPDQALDLIDYLLSIPSNMSIKALKTIPEFAPLRENEGFQALIEKYDKEPASKNP